MTAKKRLTNQVLERMTAPKSGRLEMSDELCPGLILRISEQGSKSFSVIYRVLGEGGETETGRPLAGKQHRITLGKWPVISLAHARDRARSIIAKANEGTDPRAELIAVVKERRANTFAAVLERHIKQDAARTISSWPNVERVLRLHVVPHLGDRPIADIRRSDVHEIIDNIVASGRIGTAREVRKQMSRIFNWAADRELIATNPLSGMKRNDLARNTEAGRALSDIEIRSIWMAANDLRYPFGSLYQTLMLTGQRRAEWAFCKRSEIDTDNRWLDLGKERFKSRREHIVPMSGALWTLFERLPVWTGGNDYFVFSSRHGRVPVAGFSQGKQALDDAAQNHLREELGDKAATFQHYRVHDFRVTCETRLAHLGFNQEVRDAVLGHAKPGLQKTYNKHDYLQEKRAALQAYGEHLMGIVQ
ncbi:integrase arm-type DNA-binding domain-containing protein [Mesorhizobium sp. M0140]|uniref:integrase arm-type DNA-binding domain-containing protein n=1 Tax=Mesorhizobium sp. M0140 TaxID=2956893 RepID=UPI0033359D84